MAVQDTNVFEQRVAPDFAGASSDEEKSRDDGWTQRHRHDWHGKNAGWCVISFQRLAT